MVRPQKIFVGIKYTNFRIFLHPSWGRDVRLLGARVVMGLIYKELFLQFIGWGYMWVFITVSLYNLLLYIFLLCIQDLIQTRNTTWQTDLEVHMYEGSNHNDKSYILYDLLHFNIYLCIYYSNTSQTLACIRITWGAH